MSLSGFRLVLEAPVRVVDGEGIPAVPQGPYELPVRFGDEGAPLALALGYEDEGRRLDAPHGEEGAPVALRRPRDPAGQGGAPDQVYVLPRSPASASSLETSTRLSKARVTSPLVRAE